MPYTNISLHEKSRFDTFSALSDSVAVPMAFQGILPP